MTKERKVWNIVATFRDKAIQTLSIAAYDEEHAKDLFNKLMKDREEVEIVDLYDLDSAKHFVDQASPEVIQRVMEASEALEEETEEEETVH